MYYHYFFDLFSLFFTLMACFFVLINLSKIIIACEIIFDIFVHSVQIIFERVIMKVNGGYGYGKKQGNFKRASSGSRRR